jgi:hypothetical protein
MGLAAWRESQSAHHEACEKIARHRHDPDQYTNVPVEAEQRHGSCGGEHGKHDAADRLGRAEERTAVNQPNATVNA